jgi:hypothetical protein
MRKINNNKGIMSAVILVFPNNNETNKIINSNNNQIES